MIWLAIRDFNNVDTVPHNIMAAPDIMDIPLFQIQVISDDESELEEADDNGTRPYSPSDLPMVSDLDESAENDKTDPAENIISAPEAPTRSPEAITDAAEVPEAEKEPSTSARDAAGMAPNEAEGDEDDDAFDVANFQAHATIP